MKKTIKEKIKEFLRDIFAPKVYYYNTKYQSEMNKSQKKQFGKVFEKMEETFKEMDKFFNL